VHVHVMCNVLSPGNVPPHSRAHAGALNPPKNTVIVPTHTADMRHTASAGRQSTASTSGRPVPSPTPRWCHSVARRPRRAVRAAARESVEITRTSVESMSTMSMSDSESTAFPLGRNPQRLVGGPLGLQLLSWTQRGCPPPVLLDQQKAPVPPWCPCRSPRWT
jgi:hypothetical protein